MVTGINGSYLAACSLGEENFETVPCKHGFCGECGASWEGMDDKYGTTGIQHNKDCHRNLREWALRNRGGVVRLKNRDY
jgi:hypothetical protein